MLRAYVPRLLWVAAACALVALLLTLSSFGTAAAGQTAVGITTDPTSIGVAENAADQTLKVKLTKAPGSGSTVTVAVSSSPTGIVTVSPTSLSFNDNNWDTYQNVTVNPDDDTTVNTGAKRTATITLNPSGSGDYDTAPNKTVAVTLYDNESDLLTLDTTKIALPDGFDRRHRKSFNVKLAFDPGDGNTVTVTAEADTTWIIIGARVPKLTFTGGNWSTYQRIWYQKKSGGDLIKNPSHIIKPGKKLRVTAAEGNTYYGKRQEIEVSVYDDKAELLTLSATSFKDCEDAADKTFTVKPNVDPGAGNTVTVAVSSSATANATVRRPA